MDYFTAMASSPVYEFPYSGYQAQSLPTFNNDIDALLSNITQPLGSVVYNQPPTITLQCVPQMNTTGTGLGSNTIVYQVSEDTPIDTILQQLGVSPNTLQPSGTLSNYYRSASQQVELLLPPSSGPRRRLVCREVFDSDDDTYQKPPLHDDQPHRSSSFNQPPAAIHDLLSRVWEKAKTGSRELRPSSSAPNINSMWQAMRRSSPPPSPRLPPPPNVNINNAWQRMRNASPSMSPDHQNAVSNVWHRADYASQLQANRLSDMFYRMRQPTGNIIQPPSPLPPQNQAAVHDFLAARNLPYGINPPPPPPPNQAAVHDFLAARNMPYGINLPPPMPPPNQAAVQDFLAARNIPYGINQPPPLPSPNQAAVQDFLAARNLPYGINIPSPAPMGPSASYAPQLNQEAVHDFLAARNLPYGINIPSQAPMGPSAPFAPSPSYAPQLNQEAAHDFLAARNIPYGVNTNPAVTNVWNRVHATQGMSPPMYNAPWNPMTQGPNYSLAPSYGNPPFGMPQRGPGSVPAPASFAAVLAQAHRQNLPYAGAA